MESWSLKQGKPRMRQILVKYILKCGNFDRVLTVVLYNKISELNNICAANGYTLYTRSI